MIDTHAHLDALEDDPADVVARARAAGVTRILTVGTDVDGCRRALELAERHDEVYAILGIHPHAANDATDDDVAEVRSLLAHPKAVGAGEMGLDWFRDYAPRDKQLHLFAAMLAVAAETAKPAVIHTRAADADTLAALDGFGGRVVLHRRTSEKVPDGGERRRCSSAHPEQHLTVRTEPLQTDGALERPGHSPPDHLELAGPGDVGLLQQNPAALGTQSACEGA